MTLLNSIRKLLGIKTDAERRFEEHVEEMRRNDAERKRKRIESPTDNHEPFLRVVDWPDDLVEEWYQSMFGRPCPYLTEEERKAL